MNRVRFVLKCGYSFVVTCENAKICTTGNTVTKYSIDGIKKGRPLYIRIEEIAAVIDEGPVEESEDENDAAV